MRALAILVLGGVILARGALALDANDLPQGDPEAGRKVAGICRTCHGIDGHAKMPIAPHIGGETAGYISRQLLAFRSGARTHEMMSVVAAGLSDRQIADVAAWYASHVATASISRDSAAAPELCSGCHGADGIATYPEAPNLAGESGIYIATQLKAFRSGKRQNDVMSGIAAELSDDEIRSLSDWYGATAVTITPAD